ncbi:MAG: hypothetical protein Kow002_04780 [Anaerolineales bacterium]
MKRSLLFILLSSLLLSACGSAAPPTMNPDDIRATANAMAYEMLTQTQAAMPTLTPIPTDTPTPLPTDTPTLIPTVDSLPLPTNTQPASASTQDACNQPLTSWSGPGIRMTISSNVKLESAVISLSVTTDVGECGYLSYNLSGGGTTGGTIPAGCYTAFAWVNGKKKDFTAGTSFCAHSGSWELVIEDGRLALRGGCYPNC